MQENKITVNEVSSFLNKRLNIEIHNDPYQLKYVKSLISPTKSIQAVFCDAAAGTGKTSLAISVAYYLLKRNIINQIIYVRSAVSIRELGFLPGDVAEKEAPYMQPGLDALSKLDPNNKKLIDTLKDNNQLVITTTAFLRGVDWDDKKFLIIDEAQNLNLSELQTVLTRPHDTTKVVVIGSSLQCDEGLKAQRYGKNKMLPFELYALHFSKFTDVPVEIIKLHTNYRGRFSLLADKIQYTIDYLNTPEKNRQDKLVIPTKPTDEDLCEAWKDINK